MTIPPVSGAIPGLASPRVQDSPERIKDAASQFEALLMGEILKAAKSDNGDGWGGDDADQASATAMDFANEYFARALSSTGGLGLSKMIVAGLNHDRASRSSHETPPAPPTGSTPPSDR